MFTCYGVRVSIMLCRRIAGDGGQNHEHVKHLLLIQTQIH